MNLKSIIGVTMKSLNELSSEILGIELNENQLSCFVRYSEILIEWNQKFNLTAIKDIKSIMIKHFLDSLSCLNVISNNGFLNIIDIGTGAGFPGIPIKIALPNTKMTLVDSVGKKVQFCKHVIEELGLENTSVIHGRAEDLGRSPEHRESYDWAIARAVSNLSTLSEYLLPLVKIGGKMLAQKGESGPLESHQGEHAIKLLGGHIRQLHNVKLPGVVEERYLIVIDKIAATPPNYPRRVGVPSKKPIH